MPTSPGTGKVLSPQHCSSSGNPSPSGLSKRLFEATSTPKEWLKKFQRRGSKPGIESLASSKSTSTLFNLGGHDDDDDDAETEDDDFEQVDDQDADFDEAPELDTMSEGRGSVLPRRGSFGGSTSDRRGSSESRLSSRRRSLDDVLASKRVLRAFEEHLVTERAVESLDFVNAVIQWQDDYEHLSVSARRARATLIYTRYVDDNGPQPINISSAQRQDLRDECKRWRPFGESIRVDVFDAAFNEVRKMLELDNLPRFIRSDSFTKIIRVLEVKYRPRCDSFAEIHSDVHSAE